MTHDELLAKIDDCEDFAGMNGGTTEMYPALRAVVELHYPTEGSCAICITVIDNFVDREKYPCKTIQAIEKELA